MFDINWYFKAVARPAKLFHPKVKGYNFQKLFMIVVSVAFPGDLVS